MRRSVPISRAEVREIVQALRDKGGESGASQCRLCGLLLRIDSRGRVEHERPDGPPVKGARKQWLIYTVVSSIGTWQYAAPGTTQANRTELTDKLIAVIAEAETAYRARCSPHLDGRRTFLYVAPRRRAKPPRLDVDDLIERLRIDDIETDDFYDAWED